MIHGHEHPRASEHAAPSHHLPDHHSTAVPRFWFSSPRPEHDRPQQLQRLRARLVHRLHVELERRGDLNRALQDDWRPVPDRPDRRPRLLHGEHDVVAFVEAYMVRVIEPLPCPRCNDQHGEPGTPIVLRFCGIDPDQPFAP